MKRFTLVVLLFISSHGTLLSQDEEEYPDSFEITAGRVVNGQALSFGIADKIYTSEHFSWAPEISLLGGPVLCLTMRYDVSLHERLQLTPQLGAGIIPLPYFSSVIATAGFSLSYAVEPGWKVFLAGRLYGFGNESLVGYGGGIFELKDLNRHNPVVISAGLAF